MSQAFTLRCSDYYQHVLQPLPGDAPCGEAPDYNPAFIMLQSRLQPKMGAEYGSFYEAAEPVNWTEVENECLTLLQKSKDIRIVIILMRCRLRKKGLMALAEGCEALLALLKIWPDDLHPQLMDEGEFEPMLRANAIAELEDNDGLLADLRMQPLPKASGLQITLKDLEKAHQIPREEGALSDEAVAGIMHEWQLNAHEALLPLIQAGEFIHQIKENIAETLAEETPELKVISAILAMFVREPDNALSLAAEMVSDPIPVDPPTQPTSITEDIPCDSDVVNAAPQIMAQAAPPPVMRAISSRSDAMHRLQEVRHWFGASEPGSPLVLLLKYAEISIGKSFSELLKMYPADFVAVLNQEKSE